MVSSTEPLTHQEDILLRDGLRNLEAYGGFGRSGVNIIKLAKTFRFTGCHPICLTDVPGHSWTFEERKVLWRRPKTFEVAYAVRGPEIDDWIQTFIQTLPAYDELVWNRMIHAIGKKVGMPGLTPRTLRHTFAAWVLEATGFDIAKAQQMTGTTTEVLLGYVKRRVTSADLAVIAKPW